MLDDVIGGYQAYIQRKKDLFRGGLAARSGTEFKVENQEKVFENIFNGIFGHQEACCMNSSWVTTLSVIRHLGKFSYL